MQRKRRNINFGNFSKSPGNCQKKFNNSITNITLHSIPTVRMSEKSNKKSVVAKRNPFCGQSLKQFTSLSFATLLIFGLILTDINLLNNHAYALEEVEEKEENNNTSMPKLLDDATSAKEKPESEEASVLTTNNNNVNDIPVTFSTRAATAGLTIDGGSSSSTESVTVAPGSIGYSKEHTVSVNVTDASAYTLKISGNTNLSGPSGATAIGGAGNKTPDNMVDNTWGYGWGSTGTAKESLYYQSLSTSGANLSVDTLSANGTVSFSRKLVFAAKFGANNTNSGTYRGNVTLSLVATPIVIVYGQWRMSDTTPVGYANATTIKNSGITNMQQMTSSICNQVSTPAASSATVPTIILKDSRDTNYYMIAKYADGRCWMTENLKLKLTTAGLKQSDTDLNQGADWNQSSPSTVVKPSNTLTSLTPTNFSSSNNYAVESYIASSSNAGETAYYSWNAATAGTGGTSFSDAINANNQAPSTICPKGWKLPTGNSSGEYKTFATAESIVSSSAGSSKIQGTPYNFRYTGTVANGSFYDTAYGAWWSSTANGNALAYVLYVDSNAIAPGTNPYSRYDGYAVRCIARN